MAQGQTAGLVMIELISPERMRGFPIGRESVCVRLCVLQLSSFTSI